VPVPLELALEEQLERLPEYSVFQLILEARPVEPETD